MKRRLRSDFKQTILDKKLYKSVLHYLGVPLSYLLKWMEYQFDENMTWENHGTYWNIDHVKPCNSFDLTKESDVQICYHWSNLRPLEKIANFRKNNKIIESEIQAQKEKSSQYMVLYPVPS